MFAQKLLLTPTTAAVTGIVRRCRLVATTSGRNRFKSSSSTTTTTKTVVDDSSSSVPIGASLLAAVAGVGVVATSAYIVDKMTAATCLPFSTNASDQRFSQDTFQGRFSRMLLACDPYLLIYTETQIQNSKQILLDYDAGLLKSKANAEYSKLNITTEQTHVLWEARRIVESAIHPDTGEVIPRPFRMSGYVPYNGPICVSMVASSTTIPILFWSWINQTQNALVNYYVSKLNSIILSFIIIISKLSFDTARELRERERLIDDDRSGKSETKPLCSVVVVVFPSHSFFHVLCLSGGVVVMSCHVMSCHRVHHFHSFVVFQKKFLLLVKTFNSARSLTQYLFFLYNCSFFPHHSPISNIHSFCVLYNRIVMHHHQ
jgi:hypothetical protein